MSIIVRGPISGYAARVNYEGVVFAGGGCRCFWQAGFWSVAAPALGLRPRAISAVSAGSAFACAAVGGVIEPVLADFVRRTRSNRRNFYWGHLLGSRPAFPHGQIYRETILANIDTSVLERVHTGPDIRILLARPPRGVPTTLALLAGFVAYRLDRALRKGVHARWARRLGFGLEVVEASTCESPDTLADLILQSSCMPPITPLYTRNRAAVVDGGMIDGVPVELLEDCESVLVLLSRRYAALPSIPGRVYIQPSAPVPISMWDYASPERVQETFDLGRRDGEAFVASAPS